MNQLITNKMIKSMKQIRLAAAMAVAAVLLAGCEKENENPVDTPPVRARITSVIDGMKTRAAGTAWAAGDRIGIVISVVKADEAIPILINAPYITKAGDGIFTAEGEDFYFGDGDRWDFYAYYPFEGTDGIAPGSGGMISKTITAADQTPEAQPKTDYLWAYAKGSPANPNVQFRFRHCMSRIVLKFLPGNGITALDDIAYTLDGILPAGTFDTDNGKAQADARTPAAPLTLTVAGSNAAELSSALILFPQQSDAEKTLTLTMRGVTYTAKFRFRENPDYYNVRELASGHSYIYNVKINSTTMTISPATIADWGDGGSEDIDSTN